MKVPITKPTLPPLQSYQEAVGRFYETGQVTNGAVVRRLEEIVRDRLDVKQVIAVSNCTSGLMLTLRCLGIEGRVLVPSFTFFATVHAIAWNGLEPVFVDVDEETWNISVDCVQEAIGEDEDLSAVMAVHVFGNPSDVDSLGVLTKERSLALLYDSAHAIGARAGERWIGGFGNAEVFSLSPTKLAPAGEGGIITTGDEVLAGKLRSGRDYGNTGDYDPAFAGMNARMSEFHAALAIESLKMLEENIGRRNEIVDRYKETLSRLGGIGFQKVGEDNLSTYKDFTIRIDEEQFGMGRDALSWHLGKEGIDTRKYYWPPVHRTKAYWERWGREYDDRLPVTNRLAAEALSLPIWSHMDMEVVDYVAETIAEAHDEAEEITAEYLEEVEG